MQTHLRMLLYMNADSFIAEVENALAAAGVSAAKLCRSADIAQSTWHRWKLNGVTPRGKTRRSVVDALHRLGLGDQFPIHETNQDKAA